MRHRFPALLLFACLVLARAAGASPGGGPSAADLVGAFKKPEAPGLHFRAAAERAMDRLAADDPAATALAREILDARAEFLTHPRAAAEVEKLDKAGDARLAARWLLRIAMSKNAAAHPRGGRPAPRVVVGRVVPEGGKVDPTEVLMQSPVLEKGYFATEVADVTKPLNLRAKGYHDAAAALTDDDHDVLFLGTVTLKPVVDGQFASVKGRIKLDGGGTPGDARLTLGVMVPPANTHGGSYEGRRGWPAPVVATISPSGEFVAEGLTPGDTWLAASAPGHVDNGRRVELPPGQNTDLGTLRLFTTDMGFYVGRAAPAAGPVAWEKDYATALERSKKEGRPLFVMMTATWCGPCKMLEDQTLTDPWVRHFMSRFVMVKAYEDKAVEKKYGMMGYPTLVFVAPDGKVAHTFVGFVPAIHFTGHVAQALDKMGAEKPEALEKLVESGVVKVK